MLKQIYCTSGHSGIDCCASKPECAGIVMGLQRRLLVGTVPDHEHHDGLDGLDVFGLSRNHHISW